uniref:Uncharacterized protein n=2 Tax=Oryza TaxID=4527 RepID=A0A0E0PY76_ORYRU
MRSGTGGGSLMRPLVISEGSFGGRLDQPVVAVATTNLVQNGVRHTASADLLYRRLAGDWRDWRAHRLSAARLLRCLTGAGLPTPQLLRSPAPPLQGDSHSPLACVPPAAPTSWLRRPLPTTLLGTRTPVLTFVGTTPSPGTSYLHNLCWLEAAGGAARRGGG